MPSARSAISWLSQNVSVLIVITGLLWTFGKPKAEEFVKGAVADRIDRVEQQLEALDKAQHRASIAQTRVESDLATLKALQAEQRADTKAILRELRGR
ncbi:MAG: hypothetical protein AB7O39_03240 [Flavobacteriaceae bacterium]